MKREQKITERAASAAPLPADLIDRVRALVADRGEAEVRELLRVSRPTLPRALAGLAIAAGSRALIEAGLARVDLEVR